MLIKHVNFYTRPDGKVVTKRSYLGKRTSGINVGMLGVCKGEVRHLTIPPQLMMGSVQDSEFLSVFLRFLRTISLPLCNSFFSRK